MNSPTPEELAAFAAEIAQAAGRVLMDRFGAALEIQTKAGNPRDFVTDADLAAERLILEAIARRYPDHAVLSEEAGAVGREVSDYLWVVDPLDGTTNFSRGIPLFACCLAVLQRGEPLVGVVYHPVTGELFHATRGAGAFLGERRLNVSPPEKLEQAMVCVEWGKSEASLSRGLRDLVRVTRWANKLRAFGSAALNLAYVAAGRLDAFVVNGLHPWDVAAGSLLVQEAGGQVTQYAPNEEVAPQSSVLNPQSSRAGGLLIASNAGIHGALVDLLHQRQERV